MLDKTRKAELWRSIRQLDRDERRELLSVLRRSLDDDAEDDRWAALVDRLRPGLEASDDAFVEFDVESILAEARGDKSGGDGGATS